jgi:Dyp-type peroxidase family
VYDLQDGIYYDRTAGGSFVIVSFRITNVTRASDLGQVLSGMWSMLHELRKGIILDMNIHPKHRHTGNLTVLIGFGPKIFEGSISGLRRPRPKELTDHRFLQPRLNGGGPIASNSGVNFASETKVNHFSLDHFVLQFIGDTELVTNRAVTETWKYINFKARKPNVITISKIYKGFEREDKRGWLGFHDGISNMKTEERLGAIQIDGDNPNLANDWLIGGTYLAFIRFVLNYQLWESQDIKDQEFIIGRDKITGCPILGIDNNGNLIKDTRCPVSGTHEVIEQGNEEFRDHPDYGNQKNLPKNIFDGAMVRSHIAAVRRIETLSPSDSRSSRIFRQGYEFLDRVDKHPGFEVGLNFVSFQKTPVRLLNLLSSPLWREKYIFNYKHARVPGLNNFIEARDAGFFMVPAIKPGEPFPGSSLFL